MAQKRRDYFIVKPPQTDSLAIFKVGTQAPFQYQFSLGYNFTPKWRFGVGLGWINGPGNSFVEAYQLLGSRTANQNFVLEDFSWTGTSAHLSVARTFKKFYWKFDIENVSFNQSGLPVFYMENDQTSFEQVFPNDTLTTNTYLGMLPSQTYVSTYFGTSIFNFAKRLYLVGEIGFKKIIASSYRFTSSQVAYLSLPEAQRNYIDQLSDQMKLNFRNSPFVPVFNLYLVYKLKTCDCQ